MNLLSTIKALSCLLFSLPLLILGLDILEYESSNLRRNQQQQRILAKPKCGPRCNKACLGCTDDVDDCTNSCGAEPSTTTQATTQLATTTTSSPGPPDTTGVCQSDGTTPCSNDEDCILGTSLQCSDGSGTVCTSKEDRGGRGTKCNVVVPAYGTCITEVSSFVMLPVSFAIERCTSHISLIRSPK